jgi:NDMA-dependent alcohol dehydrogenase
VRTRAAVLHELHAPWSVEEIELDPPKQGEVLVKLAATGLCHSDEHLVTGDCAGVVPAPPVIGGHEGAGVVVEVGPGVTTFAAGDHVVFGFIPACGRCFSCVSGHSNLCDNGANFPNGMQIGDRTSRHHTLAGDDIALMCMLGTFAEHTVVHESSCVKIPDEWPLDKACLFGCGVVTGWGAAVYAAEVKPGDYVAVVGAGGIGVNAVQGARMAGARGITAIDPIEFKRDQAKRFGATHTYASIQEALDNMADSTWGRGFDKVIMAAGVGSGADLGLAFWLGAKRSTTVIVNLHPSAEQTISIPALMLTAFEKRIVGSIFGSGNFRKDIPRLMELYLTGQLNIDDLVTRTYALDEINDGYDAMRNGENLRGVIVFD